MRFPMFLQVLRAASSLLSGAHLDSKLANARKAGPPGRKWAACVIVLGLGLAPLLGCHGQSPLALFAQEWTVSIRGVVIDTLTRKPVPGATIYLDQPPPPPPGAIQQVPKEERRKARSGGSGEFSFRGLDLTNHYLYVTKPGYTSSTDDVANYSSYEIRSGSKPAELRLFLTPAAQVTGQVSSDDGRPIAEIQLALWEKQIEDGRGVWVRRGEQLSNVHGSYRFGELKPGTYVVLSSWLVDNDPGAPPGPGCRSYEMKAQSGYAPEANPGVLDFSAANPIELKQGQHAVADLKLQHQAFHAVALQPNDAKRHGFMGLTDRNWRELKREPPPGSHCGWVLPWGVDRATGLRTINLPDGTYTVLIHDGQAIDQGPGKPMKLGMGDFATFAVAGGPMTLPDTPEHHVPPPSTAIHVHYDLAVHPRSGGETSSGVPCSSGDSSPLCRPSIWLSRADPLPEKATPISEDERVANLWEFSYLAPGRYWVHTWTYQGTPTYVASITAGVADLAREPLVVGLDQASPQLEVTLRDDSGAFHVKYSPPNPSGADAAGVVQHFFGMLVPLFSGWVDSHDFTFEDGRAQESRIGDLPPGHYKFYVMRRKHGVEFRNPANMGGDLGPGHDVWIKAGGVAEISITAPALE